MEAEIIIEAAQGTEEYRYAEVGTDGSEVRLYVESVEGTATLLIDRDEALALMAALGQALRAV